MKSINTKITCKDGTTLSVQASGGHYCSPRVDEAAYTHVEVGYPSALPTPEMLQFAECPDNPLATVYGYVPIEIVNSYIDSHGGIISGKLPY